MEINNVDIDELVEDPKNARVHPEQNIAAITTSLRKFGQVEPLIVRQGSNIVIGGNGRLQAMKQLGWESVDIRTVDLTDSQAAALSIALNRTSEFARWDDLKLSELLDVISDEEFTVPDIEALGFADLIDMTKVDDLTFLDKFPSPTPDPKPEPTPGDNSHENITMNFVTTPDQQHTILEALKISRQEHSGVQGERLALICKQWTEQQ